MHADVSSISRTWTTKKKIFRQRSLALVALQHFSPQLTIGNFSYDTLVGLP
jgi:hypothetical protein